MDSGKLDKRVIIETRGSGVDDWGQPLPESWIQHRKAWVNIRHLSGAQAIKADAPVSVVRVSIRTNICTDIHAGMRVRHGATVYDIKAATPDDSGQWLDLVSEVVS